MLSGTFALCVALSCNTSAQPDFTGRVQAARRRDARVSLGDVRQRRSSICITEPPTAKQRNKRIERSSRAAIATLALDSLSLSLSLSNGFARRFTLPFYLFFYNRGTYSLFLLRIENGVDYFCCLSRKIEQEQRSCCSSDFF